MGKQGSDQNRAALANALNRGAAVAAPPKKEVQKEPPKPAGKGQGKKKAVEPEPPPKSKKELEEDQRKHLQEKEQERRQFFADKEARKLSEQKSADAAVTYVEDKDTRKPKAISDISDYWKQDLGLFPFMPSDNVAETDLPEDIDLNLRLDYLQMLSKQLERLLRMKFHVFWSQVIYDPSLSRLIDSYLRFCNRSYDLDSIKDSKAPSSEDALSAEEKQTTVEVSRRMLQLLARLSRPQENAQDFMSHDKFAQVIYDNHIFDVPKIIDICTIYGDANRNTVTKIVHSVFRTQPLYKDEFSSVVQHMLDGLLQCCFPLQAAAKGSAAGAGDLSVEECLTFLPDILSCFNAMFCFFPEDCVDKLMGGSLQLGGGGGSKDAGPSLPLADLMVLLHDAVSALQGRTNGSNPTDMDGLIKMISRLLSCVLGFRMAPRHGADAFGDLLEWVKDHSDSSTLIDDLSRNGLENVAMEWIASGLVDDAQLDFLDEVCGMPLLPKEARHSRRRPAPAASKAAGAAAGATARPATSSSGGSDAAKIKEVKEVVGPDYGDGFLLQCLMHYGGSVPTVIGAVLDNSLPPQLSALPIGLSMRDQIASVAAAQPEQTGTGLSEEDKRRIMGQADRLEKQPAEEVEVDDYNDDVDDNEGLDQPRLAAGIRSESEGSNSDGGGDSSGEDGGRQWTNDRGKGGKSKGKGKSHNKGPVQGQTWQARRKESNKAQVANHNRRDGAMRKMARGM